MASQQSGGRRNAGDVDMTSMVDVTFLLLIFFMVTASFQLQRSIKVPPQRSDAAAPLDLAEKASINVHVDPRGSFLVMTRDWELETPGKQNLVAALKKATAESKDDLRLSVHVHELARLGALVAALDAGASAGLTDIQVTQVDYL